MICKGKLVFFVGEMLRLFDSDKIDYISGSGAGFHNRSWTFLKINLNSSPINIYLPWFDASC